MVDKLQAGLFSAVVTTFVSQSSQKLDSDYAQITASLVYELVLLQRAVATGASAGDIPEARLVPDSKTYHVADLWVNGLWLTSLTLALLTALISVLAKQWIQVRCFDLFSSRDSSICSTIIYYPRAHLGIAHASANIASGASRDGECPRSSGSSRFS